MADVAIVDTDDLSSADVATIRRLLDLAFDGRFADTDWEHACGGRHVIVRDGGAVVAHGSVVPRRLWIGGDEHDVGYVEAVATTPLAQGRGHATLVMRAVADALDEDGRIGVLSTGAWHFYERLGWRRWHGPSSVRRTTGDEVRTPDEDDGIMVFPTTPVDRTSTITCAERVGDDW